MGLRGGSASSLLRTTSEALSHAPTGCLNLTPFSQGGQPEAVQRRSTPPTYRAFMSDLA